MVDFDEELPLTRRQASIMYGAIAVIQTTLKELFTIIASKGFSLKNSANLVLLYGQL